MARPTKFMRSTKRIPSYFEHVDFLHSQHDSCSSKKSTEGHLPQILPAQSIPLLDQFPIGYHPYIVDVVDIKADGHCGYRVVAAELGMGEESWVVVRMNLLKELSEWRQEYVELFGGDERYEYLKKSLLVDHMSMAGADKWMTIPDMGYVIANRYNVKLKDGYPIPPTNILWASHRYPTTQSWSTYYISRYKFIHK
ncbi:uncharacterized protein [Phaseolus vulgaris]|uniref:uncharacterized protein n=1 Tax=Phaseolus vulgaris TaxID=3885 RepID=UPI0035CA8C05